MVLFAQLEISRRRSRAKHGTDHLGNPYQPVGDEHVGSGFVTKEVWAQFVRGHRAAGRPAEILAILAERAAGGSGAVIGRRGGRPSATGCGTGGIKAGFSPRITRWCRCVETSFENPGLSERARREA